jgi:hydroxyacylglutathione hydrolase
MKIEQVTRIFYLYPAKFPGLKSTKKPSMLHIKVFTFSPIQENTYLLYNDKKQCAIVDPGCYFEEEEEILQEFIEENGLEPVLLINTHCHLDHVFGLRFVAEQYGLVPHIHRLDEVVLKDAPQRAQLYGVPFEGYEGPVNYLEEGDVVKLGDDELEVFFTPGHAPGHIIFYCREDDFVIGGDVLFQGSVGRTDLPGGDFPTLEKSIREKLYVLPDDTIVYPGHGPATTIIDEKAGNAYVKG